MSDLNERPSPELRMPAHPIRLPLPRVALRQLREAGIYCQASVSLEYQGAGDRYVARGVESGGAVREIGHFVAFCDANGRSLPWLQPLQSIGANGLHAVVIAPLLVAVEIFRFEQTYELLIAGHEPLPGDRRRRPQLRSEVLFRGRQGYLSLELWNRDREAAGRIAPEFFTRAGDRNEIPHRFVAAVQAVTKGVNLVGCSKAQFSEAPRPAEADLSVVPASEMAKQGSAAG